jgi:hypothetical protein
MHTLMKAASFLLISPFTRKYLDYAAQWISQFALQGTGMCKNITHGRLYQWVDVDSARQVKYCFESSSFQMFLFAAQYLEFVSWRQYSIIFCLLLFVP